MEKGYGSAWLVCRRMTTVLVTTDGVRPDAWKVAGCPTYADLVDTGSATMSARCVLPSITLPNHASMLFGVDPSVHGVRDNTGNGLTDVPGLLHTLAAQNKRSATFYGWEPLRWLDPTDTVEHDGFEDILDDPEADVLIARSAGRYILEERPDFAFVYFGGVDHAGHDHGWMSPRYLDQMRRLDNALHDLVGSLPPGSNLLCISDHGGHDYHHSSGTEVDVTIPFLVWGEGVVRGGTIDCPITTIDVAPTLAHLLGISPAEEWEGRVVGEALRGS